VTVSRLKTRLASAALAVSVAFIFSAQSGYAKDWKIPDVCNNTVTGDDDDDPPIVTAFGIKGTQQFTLLTQNIEFSLNGGQAQVYVPTFLDHLFIIVSYTPFLNGYLGATGGALYPGVQTLILPDPGSPDTAQRKLYGQVLITLQWNSQTLALANVQFEPEFDGSSPYTIQADAQGRIPINCFTTRPGGNPVYVVPQGQTNGFDAVVAVTPGQQPGSGVGVLQQRQ
jgi:hypothetical protein